MRDKLEKVVEELNLKRSLLMSSTFRAVDEVQ